MKKFFDKFFSLEWPAWVFLAVCIIINFVVAYNRKPKIVQDDLGFLSSSVEKQLKNYNKDWKKNYDGIRIAVAFLDEDVDVYDYYDDLDLGKRGYLFMFIVEDDEMDVKTLAGEELEKLINKNSSLKTPIKLYPDFVKLQFAGGKENNYKKAKEEIQAYTLQIYRNIDTSLAEIFRDKSILEDIWDWVFGTPTPAPTATPEITAEPTREPEITEEPVEITEEPEASYTDDDDNDDDDDNESRGLFGWIWYLITLPFRFLKPFIKIIISIIVIFFIVNFLRGFFGGGGGGPNRLG